MELSPSDEVTQVVREWARNTTLDELRDRGVQTVRTVSMSRVAGLIEKAVNRALMERTLGDPGELGDAFSRSARDAFVKLVQEQTEVSRLTGEGGGEEKERVDPRAPSNGGAMEGAAGSALARLKNDLRERRRVLGEEQRRLAQDDHLAGPGDEELRANFVRLFGAWGSDPKKPSPLEAEVMRVGVQALQRERQKGQQALLDENQRVVDRLEQRVRKLSRTLEVTKGELVQALERPLVNEGPASYARGVQPIPKPETPSEKKAELLSAIFAANLELRAALDG